MKLKFAFGVALMMGVSAAANAAPAAPGISLGVVITPVFKLIDTGGALLNPVLQPVLKITGPLIGFGIVPKLHPVFVLIGDLTGETGGAARTAKLAPLPGLPN